MNNIIDTPNFINWFGDWKTGKNCSKVVDNDGIPLIVYHGTNAQFDEFKSEFMGQTGTALGQGFYFTSNKEEAGGFGTNVNAFYLNIRKPLNSDKLTMKPNDIKKLVDAIDRQQCEDDPDFGYGILSDYGDIDSEGRERVLLGAVRSLLGESSDVELVGGLINATKDYDLVTRILRKTLGYDGIICLKRNVYVIHHSNQAKRIDNINFNNDSNNFNESKKKIRITESQYNFLTKRI